MSQQPQAQPLDRQGYMRRNLKRVELPGGDVVCIRPLSARYLVDNAEDGSAFEPAALLVKSLVDANGERLFADAETENALMLDLPSVTVLVDAILDLNGLRALPTAGDGEAEKN